MRLDRGLLRARLTHVACRVRAQNFGVRLLAKKRPDGETGKLAEFEAATSNLIQVRGSHFISAVAWPLEQRGSPQANPECSGDSESVWRRKECKLTGWLSARLAHGTLTPGPALRPVILGLHLLC